MEIKFLGPLGKVTGSCCWMRDLGRGWNFLIDCGMQQGELTAAEWNACHWPFDPSALDFVVLTHAHIDHSGLLPVLYRKGFSGWVYCTGETRAIAVELLKDSARLPGALYTESDVDRIRWKEPGSEPLLGAFHPVAQNLFLRFFRSGHVMGAVSAALYWGARGTEQRSIIFSGDIGPSAEDAEYLPFLRHRMGVGSFDFAVIESTYGGVNRPMEETDPETRREKLRHWLRQAIDQQGTVVFPAFALGRTQDLLFDLHWIVAESPDEFGSVRFLLDSPAAKRLNSIVLKGLERTESNGRGKVRPLWLGKQMFRWFELDGDDPVHRERARDICRLTLGEHAVGSESSRYKGNSIAAAWKPIFTTVKDRARLYRDGLSGPTVLVVGSGTCDGGAAAFWLPRLLRSACNSVVLTGYCSAGTIGGQLLALRSASLHERAKHSGQLSWADNIHLAVAEVRAEIGSLSGYSAHADQNGLVAWAFSHHKEWLEVVGKTIFIQHGGDAQREALKEALKARAQEESATVSVVLPQPDHPWLDLEADAAAVDREQQRWQLECEMARLQRQLEALSRAPL